MNWTMNAVLGAWSFGQVLTGFMVITFVISLWCMYRGGYLRGYEKARRDFSETRDSG